MTDSETNGIPQDTRAAIRKEVIQQTAKWAVSAVVLLIGFALAGWWLYLRPKIVEIIGGVPSSAIVAFDSTDLDENTCPPGWSPFLLGRGRTLVGAGDPSKAPEKMAADENGRPLKGYVLRQHGGEQAHQLTPDELPAYKPEIIKENRTPFDFRETDVVPCLDNGCNQMGAVTDGHRGGQHTDVKLNISGIGKDKPHNTMPPFVAIYYCKKDK
ncbi:hypothetical protein V5279_03845 [Bradyrhizobium sp. 26S5]|uniref:hypothetical protein n=1 Tax=Bradyrhizobium sp. 26S5 TaxID=3139729 RepID=UPI0030CDB1AB